MGVAWPLAGSRARHISLPVSTSKARMYGSKVPAMNTKPPAVTIGPPRLNDPAGIVACPGGNSAIDPRGTCQRILPAVMSTAVSAPHGGGVHGKTDGEKNGARNIP